MKISEEFYLHSCGAVVPQKQPCPFHTPSSASFQGGEGSPPAVPDGPVPIVANTDSARPFPKTTSPQQELGQGNGSKGHHGVSPPVLVQADAGATCGPVRSSASESIEGRRGETTAAPRDSKDASPSKRIQKQESSAIPSGGDSAGSAPTIPPSAPVVVAVVQGMELWETRRLEIQQALALSAVGFVEAGIRLHEAKEEADWAKLGLQSWQEYVEDLGLDLPKSSRLIKVALFVKEHGLGQEYIRMSGETRLYLAYRAMCKGVISKDELLALPEKSCFELRQKLGYERMPMVFICSNCGEELEHIQCPRCHDGQLRRKKITPAKKVADA